MQSNIYSDVPPQEFQLSFPAPALTLTAALAVAPALFPVHIFSLPVEPL